MSRYANEGATDVGICEGTTYASEVAALQSEPFFVVEIDFSSGTEFYAERDIRLADRTFSGRVLNFGNFRRALTQNLGLFEVATLQVTLADTDQKFAGYIATNRVKGAAVRFKVGTSKLPYEEFRTFFTGRVDDFEVANFAFTLVVRDRLWTLPAQPDTGFISEEDFPYSLPEHRGRPLPVCYGFHTFTEDDIDQATGDTDKINYKMLGAWPTSFVDVRESERVFLVARHPVSSIDNVYAFVDSKGSQELTVTTDYVAYENGTLNGEKMAYIKLTSAGFTKLTDTNGRLGDLTCNVDGKEDAGDGTGSVIGNPVEVLRDFLSNYCSSPPLDGDAFDTAATAADEFGFRARGGYWQEKNTDQIVRDLSKSFLLRIYVNLEGRISCSLFNSNLIETPIELNEQWHILKNTWNLTFQSDLQGAEDSQVINSIELKYRYHWALDFPTQSKTTSDESSKLTYGEKKIVLEGQWLDLGQDDLSTLLINQYRVPVAHATFQVPLLGLTTDLTQSLFLSHENAPEGGYENALFEVIEHTIDLNNRTVAVRTRDIRDAGETLPEIQNLIWKENFNQSFLGPLRGRSSVFSRPSSALYYDGDAIYSAATDEPCLGERHRPEYAPGMVVTSGYENLILDSEDLTGAAWSVNGTPFTGAWSDIEILGGLGMYGFASGAPTAYYYQDTGVACAGKSFFASCFVYNDFDVLFGSTAGTLTLMNTGGGTVAATGAIDLTLLSSQTSPFHPQFNKAAVCGTFGGAVSGNVVLKIQTDTVATGGWFGGFQLFETTTDQGQERGYVKTTTSTVTRATDRLYYTGVSGAALKGTITLWVCAKMSPYSGGLTHEGYIFNAFEDGSDGLAMKLTNYPGAGGNDQITLYYGGQSINHSTSGLVFRGNRYSHLAASWDATDAANTVLRIYQNGVLKLEDTVNASLPVGDLLQIGGLISTADKEFQAAYGRGRMWNAVLSEGQVAQVLEDELQFYLTVN